MLDVMLGNWIAFCVLSHSSTASYRSRRNFQNSRFSQPKEKKAKLMFETDMHWWLCCELHIWTMQSCISNYQRLDSHRKIRIPHPTLRPWRSLFFLSSGARHFSIIYIRCCETKKSFQLFVNYRCVKMKIKFKLYVLAVVFLVSETVESLATLDNETKKLEAWQFGGKFRSSSDR